MKSSASPNSLNSPKKRFQKVYLEIGNICNLQCSFCPEVERRQTQLARARFRELLCEVKPFAERVCFHVMGEPLAHPDFAAFVGIAGAEEVPIEITTNGTLLNTGTEAALLHPTVHQVNFSLQSFFDNFPGANPEAYLARVFSFCQRALSERPDLYLNLRLWNLGGENAEDAENADARDDRNGLLLARIEREFQVTINRRVDPRLQKSKRLLGRLYLHYDTRFIWPNPAHPVLRERGTCHGTRSHVAVHADGTVVPCCLDKEAVIALGNVGEESFAKVVGSARTEAMRLGFERGELVEDLCRRCDFATRFGAGSGKKEMAGKGPAVSESR